MGIDSVITKLNAVHASTKSASNKQLLLECIDELRLVQLQILMESNRFTIPEFECTQRVKYKDGIEIGLNEEESKHKRFLINKVDKQRNEAWVVDAFGKERPRWISLDLLEHTND